MSSCYLQLGEFEFDAKAGELYAGGQRTILQNQPFKILLMLVEHAGEVVSREEIRQMLWPDGVVVSFEIGISQAIRKLRRAFNDSAVEGRFIETVGRRGYRLKVPVIDIAETSVVAVAQQETLEHVFRLYDVRCGASGARDECKILAAILQQLLQMAANGGIALQQSTAIDNK